ncbi:hypothetical protein C1645_805256 [Glomus cerebriforme]|uniref:Arrestin-like N-terminal domain-containing protein n=1 Tax=Glomus cerebriforme TaxID=658196 RepID=A0A397T8B4_9GLOM|nr:hypothetical protein C1645_805256 [Glomus cerebriforme]
MAYVAASTPHPNDYIKSDRHIYFSFHPEKSSFLSGYLGINTTTISGSLLVRFSPAVKAIEINLYFIGREKVEWIDLLKVKNEKILVEKHETLWKTTNPIGYELITDLTLPFEFQVPSDAIESFNSNYGSIQYTLKAEVDKQNNKKTWTEVIVPIWRWTRPSNEELKPLIIKSKGEIVHGKDIIMTQNGPDNIFEVNVIINIPNEVLPTYQTNYMKIVNEVQIKVIFEMSNIYVLITKEIVIGRNYNTEFDLKIN